MLACYWIAVDIYGRGYVYRELHEPNLIISAAAERILDMSGEPVAQTFAPPDLWNRRQDTGKSVADIFLEQGIYLTRASNDRAQGWLNLHEWLKPFPDELGETIAGLRIFENCAHLIQNLPALTFDPKNPDDCATEPHEITHGPDAIRYFVAGRPSPTVILPEQEDDALDYDRETRGMLDYGI